MGSRFRGTLLIILAALMWGTVGVATRFAGNVDAMTISFYRCILASVVLLPMIILSGKTKGIMPRGKFRYFILFGITLALFVSLFMASIQMSSIANALLLFYTAPIFATVFSSIFLKEKIRKQSILSLILCMAGIAFISGSGFVMNAILGTIFGLLAGIFYGSNITIGRYLKGHSGLLTAFWENVVAFLLLLPFASVFSVQASELPALVYLGVVASAIAPFLFLEGLRNVKTQDAGITMMLDPLTNIVWAFLIFSEIPNLLTFMGGTLILAAVVFQNLMSKKN